ncbi:MAG TPA: carboxypeptidase-like regulatory domain-containing protein [Vicinamibacterales bacterium]|nr:carboxypeptidase-like regulatory domain-containing protein [Vicinamibacterales bacterium]
MALHLENLTVVADGAPLAGAHGVLHVDNGASFTADTAADGRLSFPVDVAPQFEEWGADLIVTADGFKTFTGRVVMGRGGHELPAVRLERLAPPVRRVHIEGRRFVNDDGSPFIWRGATGFRAIEKIARGQEAEVERFFRVMAEHGVTVVRVLTMAANMFPLRPEEGVAALPRALALARRCGLHLEVVGLADTRSYTFDARAHIQALGGICATAGNAFLEIANEPIHATQRDEVGNPQFLQELRRLVPASVVVALGAAHGDDDESDAFVGADYVTVHGARGDGDNGWRFVRHTNEQRALSERVGKPVVNDEPRRDDLGADKHVALAVLCRIMGLGDTFHFAAGLHANPPEGAELAALQARQRGWDLIPPGFRGEYKNTGFVGSPVEEFDGTLAVRMYSVVSGGEGYTLGLGVTGDGPRSRWSGAWPTRIPVCSEGGVRVWRVSR